jgi:CRISPR/Cas system CMR subunit Cmr4 (Cas7 group RAMP superfamily)
MSEPATNTIRYLARLVLEAETPLAVGSGETDLVTDSPVALDINGLPYIPGTGLCGVLRHALVHGGLGKDTENSIFGFQADKSNEGAGSRLIFSDAVCIDGNGQPCEGLLEKLPDYLKWLQERPVREHVRINHRGAGDSQGHGKFDNEVVPRGVRFMMGIELSGATEDQPQWDALLAALQHPAFRVGGGTRKGYGKLKVVTECSERLVLELTKQDQLEKYLSYSSALKKPLAGEPLDPAPKTDNGSGWVTYALTLAPEGFWMFGSGLSDAEADMTPLTEQTVIWDPKGQMQNFDKKCLVIPASSVKGAISHRTAFHYNRLSNVYADKLPAEEYAKHTGENNKAVRALFGSALNSKNREADTHAGKVLLADAFLAYDPQADSKILNHVSIDRFTGGALDSALFDERVIGKHEEISLTILVDKNAFDEPTVKAAFEAALHDLCEGRLPLGGGVMRGHGTFEGKYTSSSETEAAHA